MSDINDSNANAQRGLTYTFSNTTPTTKPVFVYIYGPDLEEPSYEELVDIKAQCEEAGQPFILIPEPDASGNPKISIDSFTPQDIESTLDGYFGTGMIYENRDFTVNIQTHGINSTGFSDSTYTEPYGEHIIQLASTQSSFDRVDFTAVSDIFLKYKNQDGQNMWRGYLSGACHGGLGYYDVAQSIHKLPGQSPTQSIHGYSPTTYYQLGWQSDGNFVKLLPEMARAKIPFTIANIKIKHQDYMGTDRGASDYTMPTEIIFEANTTPNLLNLPYQDLDQKLNFVIQNLHDNPKLITQYSKALSDHGFSRQDFNEIIEELKIYDSSHELRTELSSIPTLKDRYGTYLRFSEAIYDLHTNTPNNAVMQLDVVRAYSEDPSMIIDKISNPGIVASERTRALSLLNTIARLDPKTFIHPNVPNHRNALHNAHFSNCHVHLSDAEKEKFLLSIGQNDPFILLQHFDTWEANISDSSKANILINLAQNDIYEFLQKGHIWNSTLSSTEQGRVMRTAIQAMLSDERTDIIYQSHDLWLPHATEEQKEHLLSRAAADLIKNGASREISTNYSLWKPYLPERMHKKVLQNALQTITDEYGHTTYYEPFVKGFLSEAFQNAENDQDRNELKQIFSEIIEDLEIEGINLDSLINPSINGTSHTGPSNTTKPSMGH